MTLRVTGANRAGGLRLAVFTSAVSTVQNSLQRGIDFLYRLYGLIIVAGQKRRGLFFLGMFLLFINTSPVNALTVSSLPASIRWLNDNIRGDGGGNHRQVVAHFVDAAAGQDGDRGGRRHQTQT